MRVIQIILLLLAGTLGARAACPELSPGSSEPPRVALAFTDKPGEVAITFAASEPTCIVTLELVTQGTTVPHAALLGDAETHAASVRRAYGGMQRVHFLVNALIPAGETRYVVWYPATPWYASLEPGAVHWSRGGSAQELPIQHLSIGAKVIPPQAPRRARKKTRSRP